MELKAGDPATILATVNQALGDNQRPSAAVAATGQEVSILVVAPLLDDMSLKKGAITDAGNVSLKTMTKTERNALHEDATLGHMIATLKEGLAVAPTVQTVRTVMVTRDTAQTEVLMAGLFQRSEVDALDWTDPSASDWLLVSANRQVNRGGVPRSCARWIYPTNQT